MARSRPFFFPQFGVDCVVPFGVPSKGGSGHPFPSLYLVALLESPPRSSVLWIFSSLNSFLQLRPPLGIHPRPRKRFYTFPLISWLAQSTLALPSFPQAFLPRARFRRLPLRPSPWLFGPELFPPTRARMYPLPFFEFRWVRLPPRRVKRSR